MPFLSIVITTAGFEQHLRDILSTKLICNPGFAANFNEKGSAKSGRIVS